MWKDEGKTAVIQRYYPINWLKVEDIIKIMNNLSGSLPFGIRMEPTTS
jgi:hypothetical protein